MGKMPEKAVDNYVIDDELGPREPQYNALKRQERDGFALVSMPSSHVILQFFAALK